VLNGAGGNDVLDGGEGDDVLTGGNGADTFAFGANSGLDLVTDFGAWSGDKLDFSALGIGLVDLSFVETAGGTLIGISTGGGVFLENVAVSDLGFQHFVF